MQQLTRSAGVLLAVSSLPSDHGIGDFGHFAYTFVDHLVTCGMRLWQMLPLNPLGYGNSPYQPYSAKAIDPLYLSLTMLHQEGLIQSQVPFFQPLSTSVDYDAVRHFKTSYLKEAFNHFIPNEKYHEFLHQNPWVKDYALFMTFKTMHDLKMWPLWEQPFKNYGRDRNLDTASFSREVDYECFLQFKLFEQFHALKQYANHKGVELVGDIPIYLGIDSVDVWTQRSLFLLKEDGHPTHIAGVPPDFFSPTGQRWGNPLYDWDQQLHTKFEFWKDRLAYSEKLFDWTRIDHFRAFDTYWKIPASCETAMEGAWIEAPGVQLFTEIFKELPHLKIIAEDLGDLRPQVLDLRDQFKLPGMKITQFDVPIYASASEPQEKRIEDPYRFVVYTGTHDNDTTLGWYEQLKAEERQRLDLVLMAYSGTVAEKLIQYSLQYQAQHIIIPMQDILSLPTDARMNVPGTIGSPNWEWKLKDFLSFTLLLPRIQSWLKAANRIS
jgi:4-alpha-glucanotransferase